MSTMRRIMESIKPKPSKKSTRFIDIVNEHTMSKTYMDYARRINKKDASAIELRGLLDALKTEQRLTHNEVADFEANIYSILDHRSRISEYTIADVQKTPDLADLMEPSLDCINPNCDHNGDVVYDETVNDAKCSACGEWQEQFELDEEYEEPIHQYNIGDEVTIVNKADDFYGKSGVVVQVQQKNEMVIVRFGLVRVSFGYDEIEPVLSEEVNYTENGNSLDFDTYTLKSFDYQGRGNQKTRNVPARYADNPMQNASQFDEAIIPMAADDEEILDWFDTYLNNATPDEIIDVANAINTTPTMGAINKRLETISSHDLSKAYGELHFAMSPDEHISDTLFNLLKEDGWDITVNMAQKRIENFARGGTISDGTRMVTLEFNDTYRYLQMVDGWGSVIKDWDSRNYTSAEALKDDVDKYIEQQVVGNTTQTFEATQSWMTAEIAHAAPRVANTTQNGLRNSSLAIGDIIRSNKSMHGKVLDIDYRTNMITIQSANGTEMQISGNNEIDIIRSIVTETEDFGIARMDTDTSGEADDEMLGDSENSIDEWVRYYAAKPENILLTNYELTRMAEVSVQNNETIPT